MLQQVHTQQIYTYDIQRNEQIQKTEDSELEKYKWIHVLRIYMSKTARKQSILDYKIFSNLKRLRVMPYILRFVNLINKRTRLFAIGKIQLVQPLHEKILIQRVDHSA